eukprot:scaffold9294_cov121-Isochrysis_galbana.AAC.2
MSAHTPIRPELSRSHSALEALAAETLPGINEHGKHGPKHARLFGRHVPLLLQVTGQVVQLSRIRISERRHTRGLVGAPMNDQLPIAHSRRVSHDASATSFAGGVAEAPGDIAAIDCIEPLKGTTSVAAAVLPPRPKHIPGWGLLLTTQRRHDGTPSPPPFPRSRVANSPPSLDAASELAMRTARVAAAGPSVEPAPANATGGSPAISSMVGPPTGLRDARPPDDGRRAHSALVEGALVPAQPTRGREEVDRVAAFVVRPVVRREPHDGAVCQLQRVERNHHLADASVQVRDRCRVIALHLGPRRAGRVLQVRGHRVAVLRREGGAAPTTGVRDSEGHVEEKRPRGIAPVAEPLERRLVEDVGCVVVLVRLSHAQAP